MIFVGAVLEAAWKKPNVVFKNLNIGIKPHAVFKIVDRFNAPKFVLTKYFSNFFQFAKKISVAIFFRY